MLGQILWWACIAQECLLLIRSVQGRFCQRYSLFYAYLSYVLLGDLLRLYVYIFHPGSYQNFYWNTQFVSVLLGYGVIWEIYRQALEHYPGAARIARDLLSVIFILVVSKAFVTTLSGRHTWSPARTTAELELNLRTVQAILLVALGGLLFYYPIRIGRNLRGMILGYGFFISTSLINLSFRSHFGEKFNLWRPYLQPVSYLATLLIWYWALWSYYPNPQPETQVFIEREY